ncbi:hypothetical protein F2Q69_00042137 [Brassica cretica]|uniref:Uncharacterized protein n=1 Tax=Brassica cretica TaxID=69181 RepID=A0A8S9NUL0_BRACR|nr:hypothetical protein F2Q69_00042137 [Brassica cretica]
MDRESAIAGKTEIRRMTEKLEVARCMGLERGPDIWEEWWRPACVLAMLKDMWSTSFRGQFSTDFESAPRDGSAQLNSSRPLSSFDDQVEILSRVSSGPQFQISRSSARYSAGKSEELSKSLRRFCPSPDQSIQTCSRYLEVGSLQEAGGFKETPYSLDREHSERRGHGLWLSGCTTGSWPMAEWLHDGVVTGSDPNVLWAVLRFRGQFSTDFESAPRDGSAQLNSSRPLSSFDDQVEILSRVSSGPQFQISRSSARYSAGKSEELSKSLRRFCPSPDQSGQTY